LAGAAGILIGAASVQGFHAMRDDRRAELFKQRLRCKSLAESYAKKNTSDFETVFIDRNDFSTSRNSCVASDSSYTDSTARFDVVDVVTGEVLFSDSCVRKDATSSSFCGNGRDIKLLEQRDKEFDEAVK